MSFFFQFFFHEKQKSNPRIWTNSIWHHAPFIAPSLRFYMLANSLQMRGCWRPNGLLVRPDCAVRTYVPRCEMMVLLIWAACLWQPWHNNMAASLLWQFIVLDWSWNRAKTKGLREVFGKNPCFDKLTMEEGQIAKVKAFCHQKFRLKKLKKKKKPAYRIRFEIFHKLWDIPFFFSLITNFVIYLSSADVPQLNISYKPQKISPKFQGTVRQLLHNKIRDAYILPQFVTDVIKPLLIENIFDQNVSHYEISLARILESGLN